LQTKAHQAWARPDVVTLPGYTAPDALSLSRLCDVMCGSTELNSLVGRAFFP
jgi:hypothetical protein